MPATPTPAGPQPKLGGVLNWSLYSDLTGLDIQKNQSGADWLIQFPVMNWLVKWGAETGVVPDLANKWTVNTDGSVFTFNLVQNAKWHDGRPFVADDIIYNYNRILLSDELKTANTPCRGLLSAVKSVEKVDNYTVKFTLSRFSPTFLPVLGVHCDVIDPPHIPIADFAKKTSATTIGTGPYLFKDYQTNVKLTLVRNPNYFKKDAAGRALPYLDGIDYFRVADIGFEYSLFRTGKVDLMGPFGGDRLQGKTLAEVKKDVPDAITRATSYSAAYMSFNATKAPWNDIRVRQAVNLAIDRESFNLAYSQGAAPVYRAMNYPGTSYALKDSVIQSWPGWNAANKKADIEQAKALLKAAGVGPEFNNAVVSIYSGAQAFPTVFVSLIDSALGVNWTVDVQEVAKFRETGSSKSFGVIGNLQSSALVDPSATMEPWFRSNGASNVGGWVDATVDSRLDEINNTVDEAKRIQLVNALEIEVMRDKLWYVVAGSSIKKHAWHGWLKNYKGYGFASEVSTNTAEDWWLER